MPYTTYSRAALRTLLQQRWDATPFWSPDDANLALNQAFRIWNLLTGYWRRRIVLPTVPNDPLLPLPGTLVQQTSVSWQGEALAGASVDELNLVVPNWYTARVALADRPARPIAWAPVGLRLIALYPAYAEVGSVEVDGIRATPVLTTDGETADIGPEELDVLLGYAVHAAALKGGARLLQRTLPGLRAFVDAAAARNTFLQRSAWYHRVQARGYAWSLLPPVPAPGAPDPAVGTPAPYRAPAGGAQ